MKNNERQVERRNEEFASKIATKIWNESASESNPYLPNRCHCYGYDLFDLLDKRSFPEVLFLLFNGDLPNKQQTRLLESLMIAFINPGPRHPATRAAINAAVGKTDSAHILPISLAIIGGEHLGGEEVEKCMRFLRKNAKKTPQEIEEDFILSSNKPQKGDWHPIPGFGSRFGGVDVLTCNIARRLVEYPAAKKALKWGNELSIHLQKDNLGWLPTGLVAATLTDLGFTARAGSGLFQLINAPGLLAQGLEFSNKPLTSLPFLKDEDYIIEYED